jgi:hypothetical protein
MIVWILLGVALVMAVLAALAKRRAASIQSNPNFAPTDHVEVDRGGFGLRGIVLPTETRHDDDPPTFEPGD